MNVCMYLCMYVCMYVCMCVCICVILTHSIVYLSTGLQQPHSREGPAVQIDTEFPSPSGLKHPRPRRLSGVFSVSEDQADSVGAPLAVAAMTWSARLSNSRRQHRGCAGLKRAWLSNQYIEAVALSLISSPSTFGLSVSGTCSPGHPQ